MTGDKTFFYTRADEIAVGAACQVGYLLVGVVERGGYPDSFTVEYEVIWLSSQGALFHEYWAGHEIIEHEI